MKNAHDNYKLGLNGEIDSVWKTTDQRSTDIEPENLVPERTLCNAVVGSTQLNQKFNAQLGLFCLLPIEGPLYI